MKHTFVSISFVVLIFCTSVRAEEEHFRFGLGTNINQLFSSSSSSPLSIYVPLVLNERWCIEPSVQFDYTNQIRNNQIDNRYYKEKNTITQVTISIGGMYRTMIDSSLLWYAGARSSVIVRYSDYNEEGYNSYRKTRNVTYACGPALGIEYYITQSFSLGSEADIVYSYLDHPKDVASSGYTLTSEFTNRLNSEFLIFLRWYAK